jgi:hypothetical protein
LNAWANCGQLAHCTRHKQHKEHAVDVAVYCLLVRRGGLLCLSQRQLGRLSWNRLTRLQQIPGARPRLFVESQSDMENPRAHAISARASAILPQESRKLLSACPSARHSLRDDYPSSVLVIVHCWPKKLSNTYVWFSVSSSLYILLLGSFGRLGEPVERCRQDRARWVPVVFPRPSKYTWHNMMKHQRILLDVSFVHG